MKVYNSVTFDMDGKVLSEDSFEYNGEVAECKGGGGNNVNYEMSPQQEHIFHQARGPLEGLWWDQGMGFGRNIAPQFLPSQEYFQNMDPSVMRGVWEPFHQGAEHMMERWGAEGLLGSPTTGMPGASSAALGEYYANAANNVGLNAWNMGSGYRNAMMMPYTSAVSAIGGTYPNAIVGQGNNYNQQAIGAAGQMGASMAMLPFMFMGG